MAFAGSHEVMDNIERLLASAFSGVDLPFPVMTYDTVMDKVHLISYSKVNEEVWYR